MTAGNPFLLSKTFLQNSVTMMAAKRGKLWWVFHLGYALQNCTGYLHSYCPLNKAHGWPKGWLWPTAWQPLKYMYALHGRENHLLLVSPQSCSNLEADTLSFLCTTLSPTLGSWIWKGLLSMWAWIWHPHKGESLPTSSLPVRLHS